MQLLPHSEPRVERAAKNCASICLLYPPQKLPIQGGPWPTQALQFKCILNHCLPGLETHKRITVCKDPWLSFPKPWMSSSAGRDRAPGKKAAGALSPTLNSSSIAVTLSPGGTWVSFWMWAKRLRAGTSVLPHVAASSKASWMKMYWSSVCTM